METMAGPAVAVAKYRYGAVSSKRVLLIVNERARRGTDAVSPAIAALTARGHEVMAERPQSAADVGPTIARYRGRIDVVAIGGGDGTLMAAVDGVAFVGVPLLIIPLGTVNELARALGIPSEMEAACALIDTGRPRCIDAATANDVWFLDEASIGFSTHVARVQTDRLKKRFGMLSLAVGALLALRSLKTYHLTVRWPAGERTTRQHPSSNTHAVFADGERVGTTPVDFVNRKRALEILVP